MNFEIIDSKTSKPKARPQSCSAEQQEIFVVKVVLTYFTFAVKVRVVAFLATYLFPPHPTPGGWMFLRKFFLESAYTDSFITTSYF